MPQLAQRFGFDLADAFAGDGERLPDFFQSMLRSVFKTKAHLDDFFFTRRECTQHLRGLVLEVHVDDGLSGRDHGAVLNEVAKVRVFFFTDGRLQRDWLLRDLEDLAHFGHRDIHALGNFLRSWLAPEFLHQLPRGANELVDGFDHVHRNTDGAGLIGNGAGDGLADPPRGVRGEFIAATVFKLVHGFHQADVAFLNQVKELQPAVGIFFGDGNHKTQVSFNQFALRGFRVNVTLNDFALRALEFLIADAGIGLQLFQIITMLALNAAVFALGFFNARCVNLFFQVVHLAIERAHGVNGLVHAVNQALALRIGELQSANAGGNFHLRASQGPAVLAKFLGLLLLLHRLKFFFKLLDFTIVLADFIDLRDKTFQPRLDDLVGDLFFIKGDKLFNGAHAFFQVLAQGENFLDDDGRA